MAVDEREFPRRKHKEKSWANVYNIYLFYYPMRYFMCPRGRSVLRTDISKTEQYRWLSWLEFGYCQLNVTSAGNECLGITVRTYPCPEISLHVRPCTVSASSYFVYGFVVKYFRLHTCPQLENWHQSLPRRSNNLTSWVSLQNINILANILFKSIR